MLKLPRAPSRIAFAIALIFMPSVARAAGLDGALLSWPWALPFVGILLTIAFGPLAFSRVWRHHYGKFAFAWAALTLIPLAASRGVDSALAALSHAIVGDYLGFISILFALYVVAGGIVVSGVLRGTPLVNTVILALGTLIASVVGTTGAAMILIRPLLRANAVRLNNVHIVVFFIFLVGNMGGALSPLGDPPLFIGFLNGVDFWWPAKNLWQPTAFVAGCLLVLFAIVDGWFYRNDRLSMPVEKNTGKLKLGGGINLLLLAIIIAAVIVSALWTPGLTFMIYGTALTLQDAARDVALIATALVSFWLTASATRAANGFSWEPILEVAILFAGIFVCAVPVLAMLDAGRNGAFAWLLTAVTSGNGRPHNVAYFWLTGLLSAILDNAPTYLVFFKLAGGNAADLMGPLASTLAAISMGAIYMGALTYIGNAPNFMIYAIAAEHGVKMPSFFGYIAWSLLVLGPIFAVVTYLFVMLR